MAYSAEKMRKYITEYRAKRRVAALAFLGGRCVVCDATEDLHFDHIDRSSKERHIGDMWTASSEAFWREVRKCQLLCAAHHREKSAVEEKERPRQRKPIVHGTYAGYQRGCKCGECESARKTYRKELYRKTGA